VLNFITKFLLNKEIVVCNLHRQTLPVVNNRENRKDYIFMDVLYLWRIFPISGKYKLKFKVMYFVLNLVNPKYIIDINWTSKWNSLYKVWTKKHQKSKFIVFQHGSYRGGVVTDRIHRYTKCDIFFTWSDYFTDLFKKYNCDKRTEIITFGNPIYNRNERDEYKYQNKSHGKILFIPTAILEHRLKDYLDMSDKLKKIGFSVEIKEHNYQGRRIQRSGGDLYFPKIEDIVKVDGDLEIILKNNEFDLIISDNSTALLDAIYFKNKVLYFAPDYFRKEYVSNQYSKFLKNIFYNFQNFKKMEDLYNCVSLEAQEKLLNNMIYKGDNILGNYL